MRKNQVLRWLTAFALCAIILSGAQMVSADTPPDPDNGLTATAKGTGIIMSGSLVDKVGTIIGYALSLIGIVFLGLMLYAGFYWMTARGQKEKADKAKDTITDAIIGLVIVGASYLITKLVFAAIK